MRLFAEQTDMTIGRKRNISDYLNPRSAVVSTAVVEVKPGVMEYSLEEKRAKLFSSGKCRFIVVVQKDTGTMIDWRYNGTPEYCTSNP